MSSISVQPHVLPQPPLPDGSAVTVWQGRVELEHPAQQPQPKPRDTTQLMVAVVTHQLDEVGLLAQKVAQIEAVDIDGRTALHYAVICNHRDVVHTLLGAGADINAQDAHGSTPLMLAALFGYFEMSQLLVEGGARRDLCDSSGRTAQRLAQNSSFRTIALLVA